MRRTITLGGEGPGADPDVYAILYKNVFGAKIKLVTGYPGTNDTTLAMERGEVDGLCGLSWSTLKSRHLQWMNEKKINIIVQAALKKQPELADVPLAIELTQGPREAADPQALPREPGNGAAVRGAARHPGRPQGRADRRVRRDHEGPRVPGRGAEAEHRRQPAGARKAIDEILAELYATPKDVLEKAAPGDREITERRQERIECR